MELNYTELQNELLFLKLINITENEGNYDLKVVARNDEMIGIKVDDDYYLASIDKINKKIANEYSNVVSDLQDSVVEFAVEECKIKNTDDYFELTENEYKMLGCLKAYRRARKLFNSLACQN